MKSKAVFCSYTFTDSGIKEVHGIRLDNGSFVDTGVITDIGGDNPHFIGEDGEMYELC